MTTGRINQVTIVRRVRPTARVSGQKSLLVTGSAGASARVAAAARPACAGLAADHIRFPLLNSPERRRQVRAARGSRLDATPKRPKRRPDQEVQPCGFPSWQVPPAAFDEVWPSAKHPQ